MLNWTALAAIMPLTLLINYHRAYDARILLLCVPVCAMLWAKGGQIAKTAAAITTLAFIFTGEISLAFINPLSAKMHMGTNTIPGKLGTILLMRLPALSLLAMGLMYLWIYGREQRSALAGRRLPAEKLETAPAGQQ